MKLAVTVWNDRVAPVFDCAGSALLLDIQNSRIVSRAVLDLRHGDLSDRAEVLQKRGVEALICGAMSCEAARIVRGMGIETHSFIAGETQLVVQAWMLNELDHESFSMPGCRKRGLRGARRGRCRGRASNERRQR